MKSRAAMSRLVRPSATMRAISISRRLSRPVLSPGLVPIAVPRIELRKRVQQRVPEGVFYPLVSVSGQVHRRVIDRPPAGPTPEEAIVMELRQNVARVRPLPFVLAVATLFFLVLAFAGWQAQGGGGTHRGTPA